MGPKKDLNKDPQTRAGNAQKIPDGNGLKAYQRTLGLARPRQWKLKDQCAMGLARHTEFLGFYFRDCG